MEYYVSEGALWLVARDVIEVFAYVAVAGSGLILLALMSGD